jgi:hypothetical protein
VRALRRFAAPEGGRLLRVLLVWFGQVPAGAAREIAAVVACFGFLNRWNDTVGTPLEPEPIAAGEKYLASHGWKVGKHARK